MNTDETTSRDGAPKRKWNQMMFWMMAAVGFILIALLLPALNSTREKSRRATCFNNLKAMGLSFRLYSGDNQERFPCDANRTTLGSLGLLTNNYQTSYKTWICPSDKGIHPGSISERWTAANLSYAYNGFGLTEKTQSDTPFLADRTSGDIRSTTPWINNEWTHKSAGGNVLFVDGHVEFRKSLPTPMYNGKNH